MTGAFVSECNVVSLDRNCEPAEVADVLADGQSAVDFVIGKAGRAQRVVLLDECVRPALELRAVRGFPPIDEVSVAVEA